MVNIKKLKGKIVENGMNVTELAKKIYIDKGVLYRKLRDNGENLTIRDIYNISIELNLNLDDIINIFLSDFKDK